MSEDQEYSQEAGNCYRRLFAYVPTRVEDEIIFLKYYYQDIHKLSRITQKTFVTERLRGKARLFHDQKIILRSYFPKN